MFHVFAQNIILIPLSPISRHSINLTATLFYLLQTSTEKNADVNEFVCIQSVQAELEAKPPLIMYITDTVNE